MLSKKSLQVLEAFFSKGSNIQIPIGCIDEIIEIRNWIIDRLKEVDNKQKEI